MTKALLSVQNISVHFNVAKSGAMPWTAPLQLKAVDGVSFELMAGETLGVVGESGCGKSTLARAVIRMIPTQSGEVLYMGKQILGISAREMKAIRRDIQMIFQDPLASLNPRMTIGQIVAEPLLTHVRGISGKERDERVKAMLQRVGILPNMINRYPHEFSGGQCQRIGIARALIMEPKLIICDEPVSALDVSIQAQVINLLMELQRDMNLSLIFIAHDLSVVKHISDRVMVLYLGNMVELAQSSDIYANPCHPYTQALIASVPVPDPNYIKPPLDTKMTSDLPSPLNPPSGCVFHTRCRHADEVCMNKKPLPRQSQSGNLVSCHFDLA